MQSCHWSLAVRLNKVGRFKVVLQKGRGGSGRGGEYFAACPAHTVLWSLLVWQMIVKGEGVGAVALALVPASGKSMPALTRSVLMARAILKMTYQVQKFVISVIVALKDKCSCLSGGCTNTVWRTSHAQWRCGERNPQSRFMCRSSGDLQFLNCLGDVGVTK